MWEDTWTVQLKSDDPVRLTVGAQGVRAGAEAGAAPDDRAWADGQLSFSTVFAQNSTLDTCYRIPLITYTAAGTLLAIAEERYDAKACPDNYPPGQPGGHNQVMRRSTDKGRTWDQAQRQVGSLDNLKKVGGVDYTNPSIINVRLPGGTTRILYQYSTQNNPSANKHGHTLQMFSEDDAVSWTAPTANISEQVEATGAAALPGATPGPIQGVQAGERLVMCAWGSSASGGPGDPTWNAGLGNFVYGSTDFGAR